MKTAAVFFADGFEEIEAITPVDYLRRAGIQVIMVGVIGKKLDNNFIVTSSHDVKVLMDMNINEYLNTFSDCPDCIICPGGLKGAENLSNQEILLNHIEKANSLGKIIAAICSSPAIVLGKTNVLSDKKWTCYPDMEKYVQKQYLCNYENKTFIHDKNLITARGPGASEEFAMELVKVLTSTEIFDKIRKATVQTLHSQNCF